MSKTGAWALDHQEKEQELPTFKVTEKYVMEDTWIVQAKNSTDAWNIAMTQDPDNEERGMKLSDDVEELE
jgi:hypothetical protein